MISLSMPNMTPPWPFSGSWKLVAPETGRPELGISWLNWQRPAANSPHAIQEVGGSEGPLLSGR